MTPAEPPATWTLTRTLALRAVAALWIVLGWGFSVVPGRPDTFPIIASIRPGLWMLTGAFVLATAGHPRLCWWGIAVMGALVGERITALLITQATGQSEFAWFSAVTWLGVYLAVITSASLPRGQRQ